MNLASLLFKQVGRRPNALAVRYAGADFSYSEFAEKVLMATDGLNCLGVTKGQVVAIELSDPLAHLTASIALAHIGAISISIGSNMLTPQREHFFGQTGCTILLTDGAQPTKGSMYDIRRLSWNDIAAHTVIAWSQPQEMAEDHFWTFVMGSGSTGRAKIMPVTHAQQICRAEMGTRWLPYSSDDVFLSLVSMHFYAAKQRSFEALACGAGLYLDEPGRIDHRDAIARNEITAIYATVVHLQHLLNLIPKKKVQAYKKLKALMVGGSSVSMELRKRIQDKLTSKLYVLWGTNETNTSTITDLFSVCKTEGTVGRAFSSVNVEVVDHKGEAVAPRSKGLIRVDNPTVINGYLNNPEATKKAFRNGWFYTGDIGYFTEEGELVHLGRADGMMNVGGVNVFPAEIEERLKSYPGVVDAFSFPLRHRLTQHDIPVAIVEAESGEVFETKEILEYVRERVGPYALHDLQFVKKIPRNEQGKVQRESVNHLIQQLWGTKNIGAESETEVEIKTSVLDLEALTVLFNFPKSAGHGDLTSWLSLLDKDLSISHKFQNSSEQEGRGQFWLEQILYLAREFLNIIGVPIFDTIRINKFKKLEDSNYKYSSDILLPESSLAPRTLLEGVLKVAFKHATWLVNADVKNPNHRKRFFSAITHEILKEFSNFRPTGKSTFQVLRAAHNLGIDYRKTPGGTFQLGWGARARMIDRSTTDRDSAMGYRWTSDKFLTAQFLREAGLPAPEHMRTSNLSVVKATAEKLGFPVVIKPSDCERGEGVTVDVLPTNLAMAFDTAKKLSPSKTVLVERQVLGVCHRLFIVSGKLLYAVKRLPMGVYGDGHTSISNLVDQQVRKQASLPPWQRSGLRPLDKIAIEILKRQGLTKDSIPPLGVFIALRRIETTAWGGVDEDVTSLVHRDNLKAAITATRLLGLDVAGVDIISPDIAQPWHANGAIINEINYAPLLGGGDISRRHLEGYLDLILIDRGRIPIHIYIGQEQAWRDAQTHWKQLCNSGMCSFLTNDRKTLDGLGESIPILGNGLRRKIDALRLRRDVEALVVVVQSVQCLRDVQMLNDVTSFNIADVHPELHLSNPQNIQPNVIIKMIQRSQAKWTAARTPRLTNDK